jgi:hypothetical protein
LSTSAWDGKFLCFGFLSSWFQPLILLDFDSLNMTGEDVRRSIIQLFNLRFIYCGALL